MIHNGFFRLLAPPIYGTLVYLLILLFNNQLNEITAMFSSQEVYVCIGITFLVTEGLRLATKLYEKLIKSVLIYLAVALFISVALTNISLNIYFNQILGFSVANSQLLQFSIIFGFSSLLYNLLFLSQVYLKKENKARLQDERLLTEALEKELHQFKNEVNPNLLYDSLETLITLIHKNTEESEDYIDQLSMVYRYILSNRKTEFVTISEDLQAAESIVFLLNPKYGNVITLTNQLASNIEQLMIIPGTLPSLMESIIRNTIINADSPLEIILHQEDQELIVEHKLNSILVRSEDKTLQNIQNSYSIYSEKPVVQVKAYEQCFTKIPILEMTEEPLISEQNIQ